MATEPEKKHEGRRADETLDDYLERLERAGLIRKATPTPGEGFVFTGITSDAAHEAKEPKKKIVK